MVSAILQNPSLNINVEDPVTGVNSFWLASYFGHGDIMQLLAEAGIDVLNKHKLTNSNALHVAVERNHIHIVRMLTSSGYPLNNAKIDRLTPLILAC
jgi:ankyrin repeat protein